MTQKKNGRPKICPDQEVALERYTLRVSFKEARQARKLGGGNFSEGMRVALRRASVDLDEMEKKSEKEKGR